VPQSISGLKFFYDIPIDNIGFGMR